MGQYYKLINEDKKEVIDPTLFHGAAKFYEWLYNDEARMLVWLTRRSNEGGGGDVVDFEKYQTLGRWAGDRISLVGDYDESGLYGLAGRRYTDITCKALKEYNEGCDMPKFRIDLLTSNDQNT